VPLTNRSPRDLSVVVYAELERRSVTTPNREILCDLFELMYFASLSVPSDEVIEHVVYSHPCKPPFWSVH